MQDYDIPLHDIKPIVDVHEYSLYYFLGISGVVFLLACGTLYLIYLWLKKRKRFNLRAEHKKLLGEVDLRDAKKAAYTITSYGATFKDDTPRHVEMFKNLTQRLEAYKYKRVVDGIDEETLGYYELYKGMCDV